MLQRAAKVLALAPVAGADAGAAGAAGAALGAGSCLSFLLIFSDK